MQMLTMNHTTYE